MNVFDWRQNFDRIFLNFSYISQCLPTYREMARAAIGIDFRNCIETYQLTEQFREGKQQADRAETKFQVFRVFYFFSENSENNYVPS